MSSISFLDKAVRCAAIDYCKDRKVDQANYIIKHLEGREREQVIKLFCSILDHDFDETNGEFYGPQQGYEKVCDNMQEFLEKYKGLFSEWNAQNYDESDSDSAIE